MTINILNGDALNQRFPEKFARNIIVARECLVDGDVSGDTFTQFMNNRATFIAGYPQCSVKQYLTEAKPEFEKILSLTSDSSVNLWFEHDLFCQVNMWYICYLLLEIKVQDVYWVSPNSGNEYSFASMSNSDLINALNNKVKLSSADLAFFEQCWQAYRMNSYQGFEILLQSVPSHLHMLKPAMNAQLAREPDDSGLGYPEKVLLVIMQEHHENHSLTFPNVFKDFYAKMMVYSFGDLQVYRMYQQLITQYFPTYE